MRRLASLFLLCCHVAFAAIPAPRVGENTPKYAWRGMHLDVSRHFFEPAVVREFIDRMAALKLNRLHLHLTDGPGWRVEIKAYPRLTEVGAWRKDLEKENWDWPEIRLGKDFSKVEGGFYTQQELRELVAYARERGIMIVPEVDLPGHSYAALVCYPELARADFAEMGLCGGDVMDTQNPKTLEFAKTVLLELMDIFPPDTPLHLGGDEVMAEFATPEQQRCWMQELVDFVRAHGREAITWDDAAVNGVTGQVIMVWQPAHVDAMLRSGAPLILCPCSHFYFDYPQRPEDRGMGDAVISLEKVFSYRIPEGNIRGIQGNVWTEHISTPDRLFYMAFPRAAAVAERAWGSEERPFAHFEKDAEECTHQDLLAPHGTE